MRNERNRFLQGIFVGTIERMYGLESLNRSEDNLSIVNHHLKEGSVVVYFNHISLVDPPALIAYLFGHLDNMQNIVVPTSRRHQDVKQKPYFDSLAIHMAPLINVEVLPVVQKKDQDRYSETEQNHLNKNFIRRSMVILKEPGGILVITPEGERSRNGQLQVAQSGFERLARYGNVMYVPIAIIPQEALSRNSIIGRVSFNVGEPFDIRELRVPEGLRIEDVAMIKLAKLLSQDKRGFYASYVGGS